MMVDRVFEYDCECGSCGGTGLYNGMAEDPGAGVVCHTCKGTGHRHITVKYRDFEGRKRHSTVRHVYRTNPGIGIGEGNGHSLSDFGGMSYDEWLDGNPFPPQSEDRKHTCPAWFYQSADYSLKPYWTDGDVQCRGVGAFSTCQYFHEKHKCWTRFDAEQSSPKRPGGSDAGS